MNRQSRIARVTFVFRFAVLAVIIPLLLVHTSPAGAQATQGTVLANQFFGSITGDASSYRLSADAVLHAPSGDYVGQAGLAQFRTDLEASFASLQFETDNAAQAGEMVIVAFTLTGINTGSYQGLAAQCASIAVPGVAVLRLATQADAQYADHPLLHEGIESTVVVEQWISYDESALFAQIEALSAVDTHSQEACATSPAPIPASVPDATIPVCGPDCDKPNGNR
jgi:hypothetical protein